MSVTRTKEQLMRYLNEDFINWILYTMNRDSNVNEFK